MREKEIIFYPKNLEADLAVPMPEPARKKWPQWFKDMPAFATGKPEIDSNAKVNATEKMCVPFSDSLSFGYVQETWCDIHIEQKDGEFGNYYYSCGPQIIGARPTSIHKYDKNFYDFEFLWKSQWIPKVPKGYSVLYTHPLNREDLPFYTLSGVVDSDKFTYENEGNHPFLIKKGFEGIIPQGTPMFQIIPFKRDDWKSIRGELDPNLDIKSMKMNRKFWGVYKSDFWSKKTFK
jgi:hypothetical protein